MAITPGDREWIEKVLPAKPRVTSPGAETAQELTRDFHVDVSDLEFPDQDRESDLLIAEDIEAVTGLTECRDLAVTCRN